MREIACIVVVMFVVAFAPGCVKFTSCGQAKSETACSKENFEKGKFKCNWIDGQCIEENSKVNP